MGGLPCSKYLKCYLMIMDCVFCRNVPFSTFSISNILTLSEAVRGGHIGVVEYLIDKGLDINLRTHHGTGGSPLWWAKHVHGKTEHKIIQYLQNRGALDIAPDEK